MKGLLGALLATGLLLVGQVSPAEAKGGPLRTGVSYLYAPDGEPAAFQLVKEAGARQVLTPIQWEVVAPEARPATWQQDNPLDPNYEWEEYDRWVINAVASGLTPVLQIRGGPTWAQRCGQGGPDTPCDPSPADLAAFTTAAVRRYSGAYPGLPKVSYWQGLNEPNLSLFFRPQFVAGRAVSADLYRTLINTFYAAVKAVDPANIVIAAGLGPIAVPKYTIGPMRFTRELLCMRTNTRPLKGNDCGGGVHFDIYDIHPYTTGSPAHQGGVNDVQLGDLEKLTGLLRAADRAGRIKGAFKRTPLWISEISYDTKPPDPGGLPMRIASRWTAELLHGAWRAGVTDVFWFSLHDFRPDPTEPSYLNPESGLYFRGATVAQDQPKEVRNAFRFPFVAYARKRGKPALSFWGRTPTSTRGRVLIQAKRGRGWRRIGVARANRAGIFSGLLRNGYGRRGKGDVRALYRGEPSVPFSMRRVPDFRQPPFGKPVG